jgi:hypothetical protein
MKCNSSLSSSSSSLSLPPPPAPPSSPYTHGLVFLSLVRSSGKWVMKDILPSLCLGLPTGRSRTTCTPAAGDKHIQRAPVPYYKQISHSYWNCNKCWQWPLLNIANIVTCQTLGEMSTLSRAGSSMQHAVRLTQPRRML